MNLTWIKNTSRNYWRRTFLGRVTERPMALRRIRFVVASRLAANGFWRRTATGQSLSTWKQDSSVEVVVAFENKEGLPAIYNRHLDDPTCPEIVVFMHDDVWLNDSMLLEKIRLSVSRYDIVGVAGNRRRLARQPAWLFSKRDPEKGFVWDHAHLSGQVGHGSPENSAVTEFGPTPALCELLDGVFLAVRTDVVKAAKVRFDERFTFDFYDMDFCRTARKAGLSLGTWPISLIHESPGAFGAAGWEAGWQKYRNKWRR